MGGLPLLGADAIELLREEMSRAGLDPEALVMREVGDERAAEREGFLGLADDPRRRPRRRSRPAISPAG